MEDWRKDARREPVITDLDALVPKNHLLRKIEKVMDYEWLYERLDPYYCHDNGRPGTDPVVLIKMVLIQHLFGIPSLRQTHREIQVNLAYRWFLGYSLLDNIPHFATVSYAFCKRFPEELSTEIFEHILNKALNNRMVDPEMVFIDGTHIKASANKKKYQKKKVAETAKVYTEQLRQEVNAERATLGKAKKFSTPIFGRNIWTLWKHSAKQNVARQSIECEKKPLNEFLRTLKKNTLCVIHIIEVWLLLQDGSGSNMLP